MSRPRRRYYVFSGLVLVLLVFFLTSFRVTVVRGDSMLPTFKNGQMVIVNRLSKVFKRGDVVLIEAGNEILIKRIRYLPGEVLTISHAAMFGDVAHFFEATDRADAPLRVPDRHVVVLGDNLSLSDDSRAFGPIPFDQIYGSVVNAPPLRWQPEGEE